MKSDKEKAEEILAKRERARKGLAEHPDHEQDGHAIEGQKTQEGKVDDAAVALGLGLKRSG